MLSASRVGAPIILSAFLRGCKQLNQVYTQVVRVYVLVYVCVVLTVM